MNMSIIRFDNEFPEELDLIIEALERLYPNSKVVTLGFTVDPEVSSVEFTPNLVNALVDTIHEAEEKGPSMVFEASKPN